LTAALVFNALAGQGSLLRGGELELHRAMLAGGVTGANVTVATGGGFAEAVRAIEYVTAATERAAEEGARIARTVADLHQAAREGGAALVLGFQNATPLEDRIEHVHAFHRLGLRVLQLTYQRRNLIADGCGEPADAGLSLFGRQVVEACNTAGILLDLSHVGPRATRETIDRSAHPVAFTHVNLRAVHDVPRNKSDEEIRALAERGGVVGICAVARLMLPGGGQTGATIDNLVDQIDHVTQLVGVDHVGLGLDISEGMTRESFEQRRAGFLTDYPELRLGGDFPFEHYYVTGLNTMANLPRVRERLAARGFSDEDAGKILGGNFVRLLDAVWHG